MIKKILKNRMFVNTIILFSFTFIMEFIVRIFTAAPIIDYGTYRILLSSLIVSLIFSYIMQFLPMIVNKIMNIIYVLFVGIYIFAEFGLYNFIGFFMGVGNAEQGTKVTSYIMDFLAALKPMYWLLLVPVIVYIILIIIINKKFKYEELGVTKIQNAYIKILSLTLIISLLWCYDFTIKSKNMQNKLQTESNYSLWLYPENSNLAVNNFGVLMYGYADIRSVVLKIDEDTVMNLEGETEENETKEKVVTDYSRTIDDTAWNELINNTDNSTYNTLNNYFINRDITERNEMTGIFKDKNLIIILLESVNEISILNEEDFPTLYKMYHQGISFQNNFSPRNNCSTGNNEFTVLTSLFTINNTCTANAYANNKYFEGAFNIFNNEGYATTSYHDYTEKYYRRNKIHRGLGSSKFYGVTDLGIPYDNRYEEWPSDVDLFKKAQQYYMNQDKFFAYFAAVTTHQTYNVPSTLGDKYKDEFKAKGYSTSLSRYLSKMKELDEALNELLTELSDSGKLDNTVIAMFGDHFPYGLTDAQINEYLKSNNANYTVNRNSTTNKNVDRTPMIIYNSQIEPIAVKDYTSIIDLLPTLLNMFDVNYDPRLYLGTDVFSKTHVSRTVFSDGSWQNELGYYHAPSSKITYNDGVTELTSSELLEINKEIKTRQKMSAKAIRSNYFKYLGDGLEKYKVSNESVEETTESEE